MSTSALQKSDISGMSSSKNVSIKTLAKRINKQREKVESLAKNIAEAIYELGSMLAEARNLTPHGQWETWVSENCGFTARNALNYIKSFQYIEGLDEEKRKSISDLPLTGILELANKRSGIRQRLQTERQALIEQDAKLALIAQKAAMKADREQMFAQLENMKADKEARRSVVHDSYEYNRPTGDWPNGLKSDPAEVQPDQTQGKKDEPNPEPKPQEPRKPITIEGECSRIEANAAPIHGEPIIAQSLPAPGSALEVAVNPKLNSIKTPDQLLLDAYRIISELNNGKKPDREQIFVWLAAYDEMKLEN